MANQGRRSLSAKYQRYAREYWHARSGEYPPVTKQDVALAVQRYFGLDWQPHRSTVTRWLQGDPSWGKVPEPDPKRIADIDDPVIRSRLEDTPEGFERFFNAYSDLVLRPHSKMFVQAAFSYAGECSKCGESAAWEVEGGGDAPVPGRSESGIPVTEGVARAPSTVLGSEGSGEGETLAVERGEPQRVRHPRSESPDVLAADPSPDTVDPESGLLPPSSPPLSDEDGGGEGQPARGPLPLKEQGQSFQSTPESSKSLLCDAHVHRSDMRLRPGAKLMGRWKRAVVVNTFPNSAKSAIFSVWMPAWRLILERANRRPYRIIDLTQTDNLAMDFVTEIAAIFTENEDIIKDFGRLKPTDPPANTWMPGKGALRIEQSGLTRGHSLLARGSGQQVQGLRANEIIADDIVDPKKHVKKDEARQDLHDWYKGIITTRLATRGRKWVIGTRWSPLDLYGALSEQTNPSGDLTYEHINFPALMDPVTGEASLAPDAVPLWPHPPDVPECDGECCRPREFLEEQLSELGEVMFMQCTPAETPIVMADMSEKPISEIKAGDVVMGYEKRPNARGAMYDYFRPSKVLGVTQTVPREVVDIRFESGRVIRATADHPWYSFRRSISRAKYRPAQIGHRLPLCFEPIEFISEAEWRDLAWLAGIIDGEGSVSLRGGLVISQSRKANPDVCDRIEEVLSRLGMRFRRRDDPYSSGGGYNIYQARQLLRKLITTGYLAKEKQAIARLSTIHAMHAIQRETVAAIENPIMEFTYGLSTETENYFAWGFPCHNTYQQMPAPPGSSMFHPEWIYGDQLHRGCIDVGRSLGESLGLMDPRYARPVISRVMSYDPSGGSGYAAWIVEDIPAPKTVVTPAGTMMEPLKYEPAIIDLGREKTGMRGFVKRVEWAAMVYGPIDYLVLEAASGAFKVFLEDIELREVLSRYDIRVIRHATGTNVDSRDQGVSSLAVDVEHGRIRLPGGPERDATADEGVRTRSQVKLLIDELISYPHGRTKDLTMALWFPKFNLARILPRRRVPTGTGRLAVPARLQGKRWAAG